MSTKPRDWSFVSLDQFLAYVNEAERFVAMGKAAGISPFAAALAGAGLIRSCLAIMGGKVEWWINLITSKEGNPLAEYMIEKPPSS